MTADEWFEGQDADPKLVMQNFQEFFLRLNETLFQISVRDLHSGGKSSFNSGGPNSNSTKQEFVLDKTPAIPRTVVANDTPPMSQVRRSISFFNKTSFL